MNHKKLILVGAISGLVTLLTYLLGISGTIIGSVLFSVLYTMLSEALEDPVSNATFSPDFEWDIVYVVPLVVIAFIQLLLIAALLAEMGILPYVFDHFFLSLQDLAGNHLYRILGISLLFISAYPIVLKPNVVKKEHGLILAFVGLIFLARGFVDSGNMIVDVYDDIFAYFDLPIAIVAFVLISFVIWRVLRLANISEKEYKQNQSKTVNHEERNIAHHKKNNSRSRPQEQQYPNANQKNSGPSINKSSNEIQFESNDLLDDYKK